MEPAIVSPQPEVRVRAVALTRWRRVTHGALHGTLVLACIFGVVVGAMVGTEVYRGGQLVAQRTAADGSWWGFRLVLIGGVGVVALVDARRTTSRGTSAALVLGSVATVIAVFASVLEAVFKDFGPALLLPPPLWFCVDRPTYVAFWPSDAFLVAVLACFLAGPLSLLLHLILFWREDRNLRAATGEPATA